MKNIALQPVQAAYTGAGSRKPDKADGNGFGEVLRKSMDAVNATAGEADALSSGLVSGEHANIHETMIAIEKASISFKLMTKAHRKVIEAYQEIMRMQL